MTRFAAPPQRASGAVGGAGVAGAGATGTGVVGLAGAPGINGEGPPSSTIERGARPALLSTTKRMLVAKNATARIAVVRVNRFAVERPVIKPDMPPPPM